MAFVTEESGAVTVDWVVLTAAIVGLGIGATAAVSRGVRAVGTDINTSLSCASVASILTGSTAASSYTPDYLSQALADDRVSIYEGATTSAIQSWHRSRAATLAQLIADGTETDPSWSASNPWNNMGAGQTLDVLQMHANELRARGEYPVPGVPDVDTLRAQFNARFGC